MTEPIYGVFGDLITSELNPIIQVKFPYNINTDLVRTTTNASGTVTQSDSMAIVSSGAATSSNALLETKDFIVYQPGQGITVRFAGMFGTPTAGNTQEAGIGDADDGFFIGYNGTDLSILHRQNSVDTWIASSDWNGPYKSSSDFNNYDPQKGNVYQIQYQWLGFGVVKFSKYNALTDQYDLLHTINYPNNNTVPSVYNPSFSIRLYSSNTTNNTNVQLKFASLGAFVEGKKSPLGIIDAIDNDKTITSEVNVLTIRSKTTYQSKTNRAVVIPQILSFSTDGTKTVKFRVYRDTTLGGTPSYSDVSTNTSVVEYDTAGTTITGGTKILDVFVPKEGGENLNIGNLIKLRPDETLTISAESSASNNVSVGITWQELH